MWAKSVRMSGRLGKGEKTVYNLMELLGINDYRIRQRDDRFPTTAFEIIRHDAVGRQSLKEYFPTGGFRTGNRGCHHLLLLDG